MTDIVLVILAGGAGRRIGGNKPARRLDGQRLIDLTLSYARQTGLPYAVAVRSHDQIANLNAPKILDADIEGPLGGLVSALEWAQRQAAKAVLTLPCDMPFLPPDLLDRYAHAGARCDQPVVGRSRGRVHPVCALWPVSCLGAIRHYGALGRRSLTGALDLFGAIAVDWPAETDDPFMNLNTRDDLKHAELMRCSDAAAPMELIR